MNDIQILVTSLIMLAIVIRFTHIHCKGKKKSKFYCNNKSMFLLMIIIYLFLVIFRFSISPLPDTFSATLLMAQFFFQSIIILRICQHFLEHGLECFHADESESKNLRWLVKIVMIGAYVIYFGMAIYRTIAGIKLSHDSICKSVVYILSINQRQ